MSGGARVGPIKPDQDTSNYLLYSSVESFKIQCDNRSTSNGRLIFCIIFFTNSVWNCLWYSLSSKKQKREVKGIQ